MSRTRKKQLSARVVGRDVPIYVTDEQLGVNEFGHYDDFNKVIRIRPGLVDKDHRETILHELIHAIDEANKSGLTERQVSSLARGLLAAMDDSPGLLPVIFRTH